METLGIKADCVQEQIETLRRGNFYARLIRPCTLFDGVRQIGDQDLARYIELHASAAARGRFKKFVPASGAATRMFQSLLTIFHLPQYLETDELQKRVNQGVNFACDFKHFLDELDRFPFASDLEKTLARAGYSPGELVRSGRFATLLEYLLTQTGMNYRNLPKALLPFHSYSGETRTAFEEQLHESMGYLGIDNAGVHFTIPEQHLNGFLALEREIRQRLSQRWGATFDVSFSFQRSSTDTICIDRNGMPLRDKYGRLHFRPSGHGALIENLGDLNADLVYIKNIDNVVPDGLKEPVHFWKKALGGYLVRVQDSVHALLHHLSGSHWSQAVRDAVLYASRELLIDFPTGFETWLEGRKQSFLLQALDRPIRICGVVPNGGEPGGAPFWVEAENGTQVLQIVEEAQVDLNCEEQRNIWNSSTHFNPVDIVCGLKNFEGKPFDLKKFVDPRAVIITKKSIDGTDVRVLERPGLWNGAMAGWITVFVEVPKITFNPVKSLFDLLRPEHQPQENPQGCERRSGLSPGQA
jgi:hypothetical protein